MNTFSITAFIDIKLGHEYI